MLGKSAYRQFNAANSLELTFIRSQDNPYQYIFIASFFFQLEKATRNAYLTATEYETGHLCLCRCVHYCLGGSLLRLYGVFQLEI